MSEVIDAKLTWYVRGRKEDGSASMNEVGCRHCSYARESFDSQREACRADIVLHQEGRAQRVRRSVRARLKVTQRHKKRWQEEGPSQNNQVTITAKRVLSNNMKVNNKDYLKYIFKVSTLQIIFIRRFINGLNVYCIPMEFCSRN